MMNLDNSDQETITKEETITTPITASPNVVICHNDDYNTFNHVIECLIRICKLDQTTAEKKTMEIHYLGKSIVAEGNDEYLKKIELCLRAEGLSATIEKS